MDVVDQVNGRNFVLYHGDSAEVLRGIPDESVSLSVYSPPFLSLFTYSASDRDLGNARTPTEFWEHYSYIVREILRVTKPGRLCCVHVAQVATTQAKDGVIGLQDFRGDNIRHYQDHGWIYQGEVAIRKNPQAQAIRTHSKALLFVQLKRDASWLRPALLDYILIFRKPGENAVPVKPDVSNDAWVDWAEGVWPHGVWDDITESRTLNAAEARQDGDERHCCPLQLETIERCVRLWSNPGETVLTPFLGVGSEAYMAVKLGRRAIGIELKDSYFATAVKNVRRAESEAEQRTLFDGLEAA